MTLQEVARRARVSTATVSRVLNKGTSVKSSTRARVLKVIQELNYSPNLHAQSLAGGRSRSIGVIVSNIENPFFLDVYKIVEAGAHAAGYEVIMANTDYSSERLVTSIRLMLGRRLAGVAAIVSEMDTALIDELSGQRIPVVFYDVGTPRPNITNIRVDYRGGMAKLTSYLYSLGHRRVGYIGHHAALGPIKERVQSLRDATAKYAGLEVETATDADTLEGGRQAARVLLARSPRPTALICVNDVMAVGALREARSRGLRVPEDLSVTGFDNVTLAQFAVPALTTVHIPREQIGRTICDCLMRDDVPREQEFVVEPELVVRDSTGPAPR
ncbi:MAG TPA: LacI family DNA-binding transcriptional regulator [Vicinamibacterales bacterium]|nr:LacI family DNA-binding transcriptional regulator [Vicinamibacterales bacterium]